MTNFVYCSFVRFYYKVKIHSIPFGGCYLGNSLLFSPFFQPTPLPPCLINNNKKRKCTIQFVVPILPFPPFNHIPTAHSCFIVTNFKFFQTIIVYKIFGTKGFDDCHESASSLFTVGIEVWIVWMVETASSIDADSEFGPWNLRCAWQECETQIGQTGQFSRMDLFGMSLKHLPLFSTN